MPICRSKGSTSKRSGKGFHALVNQWWDLGIKWYKYWVQRYIHTMDAEQKHRAQWYRMEEKPRPDDLKNATHWAPCDINAKFGF